MSTAHARKNPDFLYPIRYGGRKEILVVPFDHVIRVENEAIITYMLSHISDYETIYPGLTYLQNTNKIERFNVSISFHPIDLLSFLRGNSKHADEDSSILQDIRSKYIMNITSRLRLNIALPHLLLDQDIEKLYIVDPIMNDKKLKIIYDIFTSLCNKKVFAAEETLDSFIRTAKENITTIFSTNIDDIYKWTKEIPDKIKDVYFLCSGSILSNYEALYIEKGVPQLYKYSEWFEKCEKEKLCIVDFFAPMIF